MRTNLSLSALAGLFVLSSCKGPEPKPVPTVLRLDPAPATSPAEASTQPGGPPSATPPGRPGGEPLMEIKPELLKEYTKDLKGTGTLTAIIETNGYGTITCELFEAKAPRTVANFVGLARGMREFIDPRSGKNEKRPYFDGTQCHRVIPGFMMQCGDPTATGMGGPGYRFADEISPELRHDQPGTLSMANAGPNTNGSQFFITEGPTPQLDGHYNVFGRCTPVEAVKTVTHVPKAPDDPQRSRPAQPVLLKKVTIVRK